jgi:glucan phosphorylase
VTNGVHGPTWVGQPVVELLSRHLDADLDKLDAGPRQDRFWERLGRIPNGDLW